MAFDNEQLPHVVYTEEEIQTWGIIFNNLTKLYPTHGELLSSRANFLTFRLKLSIVSLSRTQPRLPIAHRELRLPGRQHSTT